MDYPQEERAAYEPRVGGVTTAGILHPREGLKAIGGSGLMALTETEFTALEQLKQAVAVLEERLQPIIEPMPADTTDGNKMAEPNMSKASGRMRGIIELTIQITRRVESLNREINL